MIITEATPEEIHRAKSEQAFWRTLADRLGYRVYAWTYMDGATLIRPDGSHFQVTNCDWKAIMG